MRIRAHYIVLLIVTGLYSPFAWAQVEVSISGVDNKLEGELLSVVTLNRQRERQHITVARVRSLYRRADQEIKMALRARGYYKPVVQSSLDETEKGWSAKFDIKTGPPVIITKLQIVLEGEGEADKKLVSAIGKFPLREGDRLIDAIYEFGKVTIENVAAERGYFEATWATHTINVDLKNNSAEIRLQYDTGQRYRFGAISIPETVVERDILEKMIHFKTGDPYDSTLLISLSQKLKDSDYFNDVSVSPGLDDLAGKQVPIEIKLTPRPKNSYRIGVGFGTDTGPRLVGAWDSRYFNRRGHRIETDLRLSPVLSSMSGSYLIPYFLGRNAELGVTSTLSHEDTDARKSDIFQGGLQHLKKRWGWNETISLTYQYENFNIAQEEENSQLLMPGIGYWKSVSDDPVYARHGYRLSGNLRGAAEGAVSDVSFIQLSLGAKYITSIGEKGRIITRANLGATAVSDFDRFPASLRFYAGGDNSIRGFDYESLGPTDSSGKVTGGRYLAVGSLEYEYRFLEKWSGAVFTDFGNAFSGLSDRFEYSVGTGVRWHSPIGLIRVDIGVGISQENLPIKLHIIVGPDL